MSLTLQPLVPLHLTGRQPTDELRLRSPSTNTPHSVRVPYPKSQFPEYDYYHATSINWRVK